MIGAALSTKLYFIFYLSIGHLEVIYFDNYLIFNSNMQLAKKIEKYNKLIIKF